MPSSPEREATVSSLLEELRKRMFTTLTKTSEVRSEPCEWTAL